MFYFGIMEYFKDHDSNYYGLFRWLNRMVSENEFFKVVLLKEAF